MSDTVRGAVIPKISPHPLPMIGDRELRVLGLKPDFAGNLEDNKKVYDEEKPRSKPLYWLMKIAEHGDSTTIVSREGLRRNIYI